MEPQLNGFSGGQVNVTIDGMKMFGACTDKMDPITSYIEPTNLKSITIQHGTKGCQTGCNIGGSMDMALQEPNCGSNHPFYSTLSFGYESVSNGRNALFSMGYAKNKWLWGLNGVYRKNDSYISGAGIKVPFSQFEKSNIHTVLKFLADSANNFKADILYDQALNVGYPALPMDVGRARAVIFALEYNRIKQNKLKVKFYYNSIYHVMDDSKRDSTFLVTNQATGQKEIVYMRMDMPGRSKTFGSYAQEEIVLNSKNILTLKVDNYINSSIAEMTMHMHYPNQLPEKPMYLQTWPEMTRNVTGIYAQNTSFVSEKVKLSVSGRIDYNIDVLQSDLAQQEFSVFNYKLSKQYQKLTKGIDLSFQYQISPLNLTVESGWSERNPTIGERFGFYLYNAYDGYDYIGNPNLKTEKSLFGRMAVTYSDPHLKANFSQSYSLINDYIMGITNPEIVPLNFYTIGTRVYTNISGAKLYSADLQLMYSPLEHFSVFILTKYTRGQMNSGDPLPLIAPLKNILSISYEKNKWSIQAENETALRQNRINQNYNESQTPSFTLFNVKGNYHLMFSKAMLDCSIGITNVLNAKYYEHLDWGKILRPGRSFNFFIKYTY